MRYKKEIAKLQFITIDHPDISHSQQAIRAFKSGCKWVQLRMKNATDEQILSEIDAILPVANQNKAILIINDRVDLVRQSGADGVHLGKNDLCALKAREMLGDDLIIGGTSNSYKDIQALVEKGVDYVGLGPFRFTSTKKNLSPIIGSDGLCSIMNELKKNEINIPVIAIGGIQLQDVSEIKQSGVYGFALAGAIVASNQIEKNILSFQNQINI